MIELILAFSLIMIVGLLAWQAIAGSALNKLENDIESVKSNDEELANTALPPGLFQ